MKIDELVIDITQKNIKNLYIKVYPPDGRVCIVCPKRLDDETIRQFAYSKIDWIRKKRAKFQAQPHQLPQKYISGETHYFKGDRFLLEVIYHQAASKVVIDQNRLYLYVRHGSIREQREQILIDWYRQQLKAELPILIAKWEQAIDVKVSDWGVKKMRTRWGTCNTSARRIWINLDLITKPQRCLEYVVVHELVHLLERKHNKRFEAYMSKFMPDWKIYREELNRLGLN